MARSHGVNDRFATAISLAIANTLVGFSGAIVVQNQGYADINMGTGMLLAGIGGVMIGDLLLRPSGSKVARAIAAVVVGTLVYRFVLALALRAGLAASDLKAVTAVTLIAVFATRVGLQTLWERRATGRFDRAFGSDGPTIDGSAGAKAPGVRSTGDRSELGRSTAEPTGTRADRDA